jgi:hypothetical protein
MAAFLAATGVGLSQKVVTLSETLSLVGQTGGKSLSLCRGDASLRSA